jgi:hypothetical protein
MVMKFSIFMDESGGIIPEHLIAYMNTKLIELKDLYECLENSPGLTHRNRDTLRSSVYSFRTIGEVEKDTVKLVHFSKLE